MRSSSLDLLRLALLGALAPSTACTGPVSSELPPELPRDGVGDSAPESERPGDGGSVARPPDPAPDLSCQGDSALVDAEGNPTGFSRCADGSLHRTSALACTVPAAKSACPGGEGVEGDCTTDADCTARPHGRCLEYQPMRYREPEKVFCGCEYSCETDTDCGEGQACICPGAMQMARGNTPFPSDLPQCVPAECRTDDECASRECGAAVHFNGCFEEASLKCRTPGDKCRADEACTDGEACVAVERYTQGATAPSREWQCAGMSCVIGRPLLVDGLARTASWRLGESWAAPVEAARIEDPVRRREVAAHWRAAALLEHASVASFARFVQQLLALGAPSHLIRDAQRAMLDEIEHARLCFALALAQDEAATPGPLDLRGTTDPRPDRLTVAESLIQEACIGETLGVAEALAAAAACVDAPTRQALARIAADETRHAALAWRTLRWLHDTSSPGDRSRLAHLARLALSEARCRLEGDGVETPAPGSPPHGVPSAASRRGAHRAALAEVVGPCVDALFGPAQAESRARPRAAASASA